MVYLEQSVGCCRPLVLSGGYVPVREKDLVHSHLQCSSRSPSSDTNLCSYCSAVQSGVQYVGELLYQAMVFVWQIIAFVLAAIGKFFVPFRLVCYELCDRLVSWQECPVVRSGGARSSAPACHRRAQQHAMSVARGALGVIVASVRRNHILLSRRWIQMLNWVSLQRV